MSLPPPIQRISAARLSEWLRKGPLKRELVVVDVRDQDFEGGHMRGCFHIPSSEFEERLANTVREFEDVDNVVFHCMLSQQRAPYCAKLFHSALPKGVSKCQVYILDKGYEGFSMLKTSRGLIEGAD
eukprot:Sdes_comp17451_c0_seq3m6677